MSTTVGERAWVFKTTSDDARSWSANQGYDDSTGIYYSYDSNVGRCRQVQIGDLIVIREDNYVAGWAFVEHIEITENSQKEIPRCPNCKKTDFYPRKTISPANRCNDCKYEFHHHETFTSIELVTAYRAYYANSWEEASRPVLFPNLNLLLRLLIHSTQFAP